jgi:hypothetical protein
MMTVVSDLVLRGWEGRVTVDAGVGAGFFSHDTCGVQDFGGRFTSSYPQGFA